MRAIYLPKIYIAKAFPFLSVTAGSAVPLIFPEVLSTEVFSKALGMFGRVVNYNFSSLYGPLLNNLAPTIAVVASVASTPLVGSFEVPVFSKGAESAVEVEGNGSSVNAVISPTASSLVKPPRTAGAQSHTQDLSDVTSPAANISTLSWVPASSGMEMAVETADMESAQHPLSLTQASSQGTSISADMIDLGISGVTPISSLVTPTKARAQSYAIASAPTTPVHEALMGQWVPGAGKIAEEGDGAIAEEIQACKDLLQRAGERIKILLLKRKSLRRDAGITPELLEKIDWMNLKQAGLSEIQESRLEELLMMSSIECKPEGIGDCQESDGAGDKFEDKIRLFNLRLPSKNEAYYTTKQVRHNLAPLVRTGITSEEKVENLMNHPLKWL
jgi:hypothetical protein